MSELVTVTLLPSGTALRVARGTPLQDLLFSHGVEFPCGGHGKCKGCRVKARISGGTLPISPEDRERLSSADLLEGWRLACQAKAESDLTLELAQWEAAILSDDSPFSFTPHEGWGIAVDLGTTTIVAQLIDLQTGNVLAVSAGLNLQAKHGADIMSRVEFAVANRGQQQLQTLIRDQIGGMVKSLLDEANRAEPARIAQHRTLPALKKVVIVGNTVMHHLFCGVDLEPLSHFPFEPLSTALHVCTAAGLGWSCAPEASVRFLPCLGGFVGSDILAGILATKLHETGGVAALVDLGTNGEIVVGDRTRLLCASTAAGPAFEGARISMGMRAATGAIAQVQADGDQIRCHVLGDEPARGICGSGLVDAVAVGLDLGRIESTGRFRAASLLPLVGPVALTQADVRELQLAKGAIAAGLRILLDEWGAQAADLDRLYLAGAFGNYINYTSAQRIGLLNFPAEKVKPVGNTALLGAKLALFTLDGHQGSYPEILSKTKHMSLSEHPRFQDIFVEELCFPSP